MKTYLYRAAALGTAAFALACQAPAAPADLTTGPLKFTFLHISDSHLDTFFTPPDNLDKARSYTTVRTMKNLGAMVMAPFNFTAQPPSFIIHTGDICEFGMAGVTLDVISRYFDDLGVPVFYQLGNHDGTWAPPLPWMKKKYGSLNYSFDYLGVHFVGLKSAGLQDPRPSFGQEVVNFLKADLAKVSLKTPVIIYFHHPLPGDEFASRYDYDRLLDVAERHNIILMLVGHGHQPVHMKYDNIDIVEGGSSFSKGGDGKGGYNFISLDGKNIRVAYRYSDDTQATRPLLNKPIPEASYHPDIKMTVTQQGAGDDRQVLISAKVSQAVLPVGGGTYVIDENLSGPLRMKGDTAAVAIPVKTLEPGVHYARFNFTTSKADTKYDHSIPFAVERYAPGQGPIASWRFQTGGSSRVKPLLHGDTLYVGANDGFLYALDAKTGAQKWALNTGSPITAAPVAYKDSIIYGTGDGFLRAATFGGQHRWAFETGSAVMGHPVIDGDFVYFASTGAAVYCLDAASGQKKWENTEPRFQIETKPIVSGGRVYVGAWDGKLYALDADSGKTLWSKPGPRNQGGGSIPQYYSPADADMVLIGQKLFVTDRANQCGTYDLEGNFLKEGPKGAAAFAPGQDGKSVYLRRLGNGVTKLDLDLNEQWKSDIVAGSLPYAPVEHKGTLYGVTSTGNLYALDAATGKTRWTYRVTPSLYVHTSPLVTDTHVYTIGEDGVVTAVQIPANPS